MSETRASYLVSGLNDQRLRQSTLLLFDDPAFSMPGRDDIQAIMRMYGLTGSKVAKILGVDSRAVRRWIVSEDHLSHRQMPYASWRLLLVTVGLVEQPKIDCVG